MLATVAKNLKEAQRKKATKTVTAITEDPVLSRSDQGDFRGVLHNEKQGRNVLSGSQSKPFQIGELTLPTEAMVVSTFVNPLETSRDAVLTEVLCGLQSKPTHRCVLVIKAGEGTILWKG